MPTKVAPLPAPAKRKRGRESVGDMIRSLGLVLLIVVALWFLARPPASDSQALRVVDPASDIAALRSKAPGIPVPARLPAGWRSTSSTPDAAGLRIGYVTPTEQYAEFSAAPGSAEVLAEFTGHGRAVGTFVVQGVPWQQFEDSDHHTSLVRTVDSGTVAVGGVRETTTLDELRTLAASVS